MTTLRRLVPVLAMVVAGMVGGAAASLFLGGHSVVLADEQATTAVITKAVHLADADGHVRAIITIGKDNEPEVSVLNEKGKVVKREKLIASQEPSLITGLGDRFRITLRDRSNPKAGGIELQAPSDHQCLVLNPQVGFASDTP